MRNGRFSSPPSEVSPLHSLKGDIVEALQFLKCLLRKDLIFREPPPTSALEHDLEIVDDDSDVDWVDEDELKSWDSLLIDVDGEDSDDNY